MPAAKKSKAKSTGANGPVTRSRIKESPAVDVTTYTTLNGGDGSRPIQVVSKRALKSDPKQYAELEKRFERIEAKRQQVFFFFSKCLICQSICKFSVHLMISCPRTCQESRFKIVAEYIVSEA